jgi:hypothetical protein
MALSSPLSTTDTVEVLTSAYGKHSNKEKTPAGASHCRGLEAKDRAAVKFIFC